MKNQTIEVGTIKQISEAGFSAPAYREPRYEIGERWGTDYTGENPAAHGNIVVTEEESSEGRQRSVAINGAHREVGPWGPTRAQREKHAAHLAAKARAEREAEEDRAAEVLGLSLISTTDTTVTVSVRGEKKTAALSAIREAAADPWSPRLTREAALKMETAEDRLTRFAYRSILRRATK